MSMGEDAKQQKCYWRLDQRRQNGLGLGRYLCPNSCLRSMKIGQLDWKVLWTSNYFGVYVQWLRFQLTDKRMSDYRSSSLRNLKVTHSFQGTWSEVARSKNIGFMAFLTTPGSNDVKVKCFWNVAEFLWNYVPYRLYAKHLEPTEQRCRGISPLYVGQIIMKAFNACTQYLVRKTYWIYCTGIFSPKSGQWCSKIIVIVEDGRLSAVVTVLCQVTSGLGLCGAWRWSIGPAANACSKAVER